MRLSFKSLLWNDKSTGPGSSSFFGHKKLKNLGSFASRVISLSTSIDQAKSTKFDGLIFFSLQLQLQSHEDKKDEIAIVFS